MGKERMLVGFRSGSGQGIPGFVSRVNSPRNLLIPQKTLNS